MGNIVNLIKVAGLCCDAIRSRNTENKEEWVYVKQKQQNVVKKRNRNNSEKISILCLICFSVFAEKRTENGRKKKTETVLTLFQGN